MDGDPLYVSTTINSEDLHLQEQSPAIDAGVDLTAVLDDYDKETRPYNITDIGADEMPSLTVSPDNLASDPKVSQVTLSWLMDENYPVTSYTLMYSEKENLSDATTVTCDENAVATLTDLKPAKKYYAKVLAVYETSYSTYSSDYSDTLEFGTKPTRVSKLKNLITVHNYSQWRFQKQRRVFNYVIKLMDENGEKIRTIKIKKNKAFVRNSNKKWVRYSLSGLESGGTYKIKIRAKKKVNHEWLKGKWSKLKTFSTMADPAPEL